jgi:hypothetical protein
MLIPTPSKTEIKKYLIKWDSLENYSLQEKSLRKLFFETYPLNTKIEDVLVKVCVLNDFYSTNIFSPFIIAQHIVALDIDKRLQNKDLTLINDIAKVKVRENKEINFYSFATKYCSHHNPNFFPIYDSFVDRILIYYKKVDTFSVFSSKDLKNYILYKRVLKDFQKFYNLEEFSIKDIDKYLWLLGKEYFPKKY